MRTLIRGGLVLDCTGQEPLHRGAVLIDEGRIASVGLASEFASSLSGVELIDAAGCTVMPGLVDGHVHVLGHPQRNRFTEGEAAVWGMSYLPAALRRGVTTVRDMGERYEAIFALKRAVHECWLVGPRLLAAGCGICMTGGDAYDVYTVEADGPDAVRRAARLQIKAGADVVKLMATGGAGPGSRLPTSAQLGSDELRAGVEEAHKAGLPVAAHATSVQGARNALIAGVDSIEHGCNLDEYTIGLMLKNNVALSPTLSIYPRIVDGKSHNLAPEFMARRAATLMSHHLESFQEALAAGVKVVMGTDCGSPWHPLGDIAYELELWVRAGMKPQTALEAATRVTAEACNVGQDVGSLKPGKRADLLLVEGDATVDISAMARVRRVLRDGVTVYDSATREASAGLIGKPVMGPLPEWLYC